jgi:hypothetical protein
VTRNTTYEIKRLTNDNNTHVESRTKPLFSGARLDCDATLLLHECEIARVRVACARFAIYTTAVSDTTIIIVFYFLFFTFAV